MTAAGEVGQDGTVQIFISYSARNPEEVELSDCLIALFTAAFALPPRAIFAYTAAGHGVKSGSKLLDELKLALAGSRVVLAVATPGVAESSYSQFEAAASDLAGKYRVPLLPDPSFHDYVPAVFKEITARNLGSVGEICQLLEDMGPPLRATVQPACLWITKAQRVVEAAHAVAGKVPPEARIEELEAAFADAARRQSTLTRAAIAAGACAMVATIAASMLWMRTGALRSQVEDTQTALDAAGKKALDLQGSINEANRRYLYLPALQVEGDVRTAAGTPVDRALVVACAAVPSAGAGSAGQVCPEDLRLSLETDSDGVYRLDLRSLPAPESALQALGPSPPEEFWLVAQHGSGGRVQARVKTVLVKNLLLRP
jgi:hypothetical protein